MSQLREEVTIKTATGTLNGRLFVGADGLPELELSVAGRRTVYRPATFPAAWRYRQVNTKEEAGPLLTAWIMIEATRSLVAEAQREADAEEVCRQGDGHISHDVIGDTCIRCGKPFSGDGPHDHARQRSIDNQIAVEVDHQRKEEVAHDQRT